MFFESSKYKGKILFFILFALFSVASISSAQVANPPGRVIVPKPDTQPTPKNYPKPPKKIAKPKKTIINESPTPAEKSIAVDERVNISLCVAEGRVKVNGWNRNEIRAFISYGSEIGFKIRGKNRQNKPILVTVVGFDPKKTDEAEAEECLSGDDIELDVPHNAVVQIKSSESDTSIESIRKALVENVGGNIFLNDIAEGIEAKTYQGGITVEKSSGTIKLGTISGNIIALDISASEIGDVFKAKSNNGTIVLRNLEQRQVEVTSNSGTINFNGEFLSGGQYRFGTLNGSIVLAIPEKSSCLINATYGFGAFTSDFKLQNVKKTNPSGVQNLTGQLGSGEATLDLTTSYGRINIKKQ
jgi:DUF4097 and DUF4098 domain-containing protein YvlB